MVETPTRFTDWKKLAASAAQSSEDVEKAFLDQAYTVIQGKATPIMRAPYRVGFEVVFKNDDNTRMVGIFIFRAGKELFYAPVFFLNGSIKGTDLFYRHSTKMFVPLTNPWVEYLLSLAQAPEGHGVPFGERQLARNQLNLMNIVEPPTSHKYASAREYFLEKMAEMSVINEMPKESLLRRFITETGGFNAMRKLANTAERNFEFANALFLASKPENYSPQLEPLQLKQASKERVPMLTLHTNILFNKQVKNATAQDLVKGYRFEDLRKQADLNDVVWTDNSETLQQVNDPGVYDVLMADGSRKELLVALSDEDLTHSDSNNCGCSYSLAETKRLRFLDAASGKTAARPLNKVLGSFIRDLKKDKEEGSTQTPETGKSYLVFNSKENTFSNPFHVTRIDKSSTGITQVWIARYNKDSEQDKPLLVNPDYAGFDKGERILGTCCHFIQVTSTTQDYGGISYDEDLDFGSTDAVYDFVFENGYKRATIKKIGDNYRIQENLHGPWSGDLFKVAAIAALMSRLDLKETTAEDVIKEADAHLSSNFFYRDMAKEAHNLRFNSWPDFTGTTNFDFGVNQEPDTQHIQQVDRDVPYVEPHRIGDQYTHDTSENTDTVPTESPMQLYELSKNRGVGNLFEHGVVGSLTQTYDSMAMLDKYLPDMEQALDRVGRILFLYYWKPEDFSAAFGSDDQSQIENKLVSCFKSFGDLVLEFLMKNRQQSQGSVSLT